MYEEINIQAIKQLLNQTLKNCVLSNLLCKVFLILIYCETSIYLHLKLVLSRFVHTFFAWLEVLLYKMNNSASRQHTYDVFRWCGFRQFLFSVMVERVKHFGCCVTWKLSIKNWMRKQTAKKIQVYIYIFKANPTSWLGLS